MSEYLIDPSKIDIESDAHLCYLFLKQIWWFL